MEVLGRDSMREAYRVATGGPDGPRLVGLIPDGAIAEGLALTGGRGHQTAYEWLARHAGEIETALTALGKGKRPRRAPFDRIELVEDT